MKTPSFTSHAEYLASVPVPARAILKQLQALIRQCAPGAEEVISYNMPAFKFHGMLCYYAAFKEHVSLFPGNGHAIDAFKEELRNFRTSKGTIQFPIGTKIPVALVKRLIKYRVKQQQEKALLKQFGKRG